MAQNSHKESQLYNINKLVRFSVGACSNQHFLFELLCSSLRQAPGENSIHCGSHIAKKKKDKRQKRQSHSKENIALI